MTPPGKAPVSRELRRPCIGKTCRRGRLRFATKERRRTNQPNDGDGEEVIVANTKVDAGLRGVQRGTQPHIE